MIPPAYGLNGVGKEIYTGDDTVSYWNAYVAARGPTLFNGAGRRSSCHTGSLCTDVNHGVLHVATEVGQDPAHALRSVTGKYRTTTLRGLAQHAPYFHDGSAGTLLDVVEH